MMNEKKVAKKMELFLVIWVYLKPVLETFGLFIENHSLLSFFYYVALVIAVLFLCLHKNMKFRKSGLMFLSFYLLAIFLNVLLVNYRYYVLVDGCTNFLIAVVPALVISDKNFELEEFTRLWLKASHLTMLLLGVYLFCYKAGFTNNYGVFAEFTLPNSIILSFSMFHNKKSIRFNFFCYAANFLFTFLFGGRMASLVIAVTFLFCFMVYKKLTVKKLLLIMSSLIGSMLVVMNLPYLIAILYDFMLKKGLYSRTLYLLNVQLKKGSLFENVYVTNRDYIYETSIEYIKNHFILPNGFAVVRSLTDGVYYHAHNLILELIITFGCLGSIFAVLVFIQRFREVKAGNTKYYYDFCSTLLIFYLLLSLTGSYFINSFASLLLIFLVFFHSNIAKKNFIEKGN